MANSYVGGKVEYILDANDTALRAGLSSAKNKMDEFGNAAQATASRTSATFGGLGSTITKVVAAFALEETARKFLTFGIASATALQTTSTYAITDREHSAGQCGSRNPVQILPRNTVRLPRCRRRG